MKEADLPSFDYPEEKEIDSPSGPTLSIDLSTLFTSDVYSSGTFDLSAISSSSIGKLLHALPIPVLLIDQWCQIGFANRACSKISSDYRKIMGVLFADLVPLPSDVHKARTLTLKIQALIERAFETRRPQMSEAILKIDDNRIWARLHLRSVRIGLERHVLLIIEDLTSDKRQLILTQRNDEKYRKANFKLGRLVEELTEERRTLTEKLRGVTTQHAQICRHLAEQKQILDVLWDRTPAGLVLIGEDGIAKQINSRFTQMFGYELADLSGSHEWISGMEDSDYKTVSSWLNQPERQDDEENSNTLKILKKDGACSEAFLLMERTPDQNLLLIFEETVETCG